MSETYYSKEHQWVRLNGAEAVIGISDFAQKSLGDVVYVELPALAAKFAKDEQAAVVESVKTASEVYAPVGGVVSAVNTALAAKPDLVNSDPEGAGWFFKLTVPSPPDYSGLMTEAAYRDFVKGLE